MSDESKIEWCDSTFNPWIGCTKISPACDHCYAEAQMDTRLGRARWGAGQARVRTSPANWRTPLRWDRSLFHECVACGWRGEDSALASSKRVCPTCSGNTFRAARRRVFCASLADVFDNEVDSQWRSDLFELIRATPSLDWLLLTKRIGNAQRMIEEAVPYSSLFGPLNNVWLGATICNQSEADRDIPKLLAVPAAVRFLSIEPMLGPIDLRWAFADIRTACCHRCGFRTNSVGGVCPNDGTTLRGDIGLDWVIAGGESGPHARPSHPDWLRSLRDQCAAAGVPFLFKQWGEHSLEYDRDRDDPDWRKCDAWSRKPGRWINLAGGQGFHGDRVHYAHRVGKKAAGRLLDGSEHNEFPSEDGAP